MLKFTLVLLIVPILALAACGDGGDSGDLKKLSLKTMQMELIHHTFEALHPRWHWTLL